MATINVRIATPEDDETISALLKVSYAVLMVPDYTREVVDAVFPLISQANPGLLKSGTFYLAETGDGEIIGCGGWTAARPGQETLEPGLGHIRHFATHPDWTHQGVASAVINACKDAAKQTGIDRLECYSSLSAVGFYAAQGFKVKGPIDIPITKTSYLPSVIMTCVI